MKWSQDGSLLVTVGINDTNVFRTQNWTRLRDPIPTGRTTVVDVFSGVGKESALVLVANEDGKVMVIDAATGDIVFSQQDPDKMTPCAVRFLPNCSDIIYAGNIPRVRCLRWLPLQQILAESKATTVLPHDVLDRLTSFSA